MRGRSDVIAVEALAEYLTDPDSRHVLAGRQLDNEVHWVVEAKKKRSITA